MCLSAAAAGGRFANLTRSSAEVLSGAAACQGQGQFGSSSAIVLSPKVYSPSVASRDNQGRSPILYAQIRSKGLGDDFDDKPVVPKSRGASEDNLMCLCAKGASPVKINDLSQKVDIIGR